MKESFNIIIKDDFLNQNLYKKIYKEIETYTYLPKHHVSSARNHFWYACKVQDNLKKIIKNKCEKIFNKKFKTMLCDYTMVASVEPFAHCDIATSDYQIIVYIKGNTDLHKGTGFYLNNELNTHVGFNENRAILWKSNAVHSPLNWASDDKSKRFSIISQLKEIKD